MGASVLDDVPKLPTQPVLRLPAVPEEKKDELPARRAFADTTATRRLIYANALQALQEVEPVSNERYTLALHDVHYNDPEQRTIAERKRAILTGQTLGRRIQGTWTLTDTASGKEVAKRRSFLASVPHLTEGGTYVNRGNEYTMCSQLRLRPGVFTRIKDNGELEAHVNVLPGKGAAHRVFLDPETGVFRLQLGQARLPLVPVLRLMGVTDTKLREAWGNDLTAVNLQKDDPKAINKLYAKLVRFGEPAADAAVKKQAIADAFNKMELDPEVTQRTLGAPYTRVDATTLLATTRKLLAVSRREEDPDDRDHLAYQTVYGPEDVIADRIRRARGVARKLLWKATVRNNLEGAPAGLYNAAIQGMLINSGLGQPIEEVNPSDIFDQAARITRMGESGIPGLESVPDEARAVQPSQLGFIDFLRTPESLSVGVDMRIARAAQKGRDGRFYIPVQTAKGRTAWRSSQDLADSVMAFPGERKRAAKQGLSHVAALARGKVRMVPTADVEYELPHLEDAFSPLGNMIPLKSMVKGQRAVMAARMLTQALPLTDPESPFVQSGVPERPGHSFEAEYGKHMGALRAKKPCRVLAVNPDGVDVRYQDGSKETIELYNQLPYNRLTFLHQTAQVRPGDTVAAGALLATSNYTDAAGTTALGKNARVAYLPFRGLNFEDAIVISESFAKRMQSEHAHQHNLTWEETHKPGKRAYTALFPAKYPRRILDQMDATGVVLPGTTVEKGDPLVLVAKERERTHRLMHRGAKASHIDETVTWEHDAPGIVMDSVLTDKGVNVVVKSQQIMREGDKLSGRYGDKGIISAIVPDAEMPRLADSSHAEVLLNPLGIISRVNPAQIVEAALGKIAAKTGKSYKLADFEDQEDMVEFALAELRKHRMADVEAVTDPETERKIPGILVGNRFFMKLKQTAEHYGQGRGLGSYTAEMLPAKGGAEGGQSKRIGMLALNSLLSHGGHEVIRDAKQVRGQANPDYWRQFMSGYKPPTPTIPHVYKKFVAELQGAGINVVREGTRTHIMALTDKDIDKLAGNRQILNTGTVDWKKGLRPVAGGLFDEKLTGGNGGTRWSYIKLHEPLPSPVMEEPIRRLLGLTQGQLESVITGERKLGQATGPRALQQALAAIDLDKEIARARADVRGEQKTKRDNAIRRLGYLRDAKRLDLHPKDWMLSKIPVLPPAFRPVSVIARGGGQPLVADANYLYKEAFEANQALAKLSETLGDEGVGDERLTLYKAFRAVTGLGDPTHPKNQERKVKGILKHVFGSSPKHSHVQSKLLGASTDLVGRSVIAPDPDLDMDQVGLPESKAWVVYRPFVVRNLVRRGVPKLQAARNAEEKSPLAREALVAEMSKRPVVINRAPTMHRYGIMAFWPRLERTDTLRVSPLVVGGFGADFDGDAMQYHVPATDEAAQEAAERMLPSRNLLSSADFGVMYKPSQEYVGGLYEASVQIDTKNPPRVFETKADAIRAYRRGEINVDRRVTIREEKKR